MWIYYYRSKLLLNQTESFRVPVQVQNYIIRFCNNKKKRKDIKSIFNNSNDNSNVTKKKEWKKKVEEKSHPRDIAAEIFEWYRTMCHLNIHFLFVCWGDWMLRTCASHALTICPFPFEHEKDHMICNVKCPLASVLIHSVTFLLLWSFPSIRYDKDNCFR